jgi:hypothetical protein
MTLVSKSVAASILVTRHVIHNEAAPYLTPHFDILRKEPMRLIVDRSALEVFSQQREHYRNSVFDTIVNEAHLLLSETPNSPRYSTYIFGQYIFNMTSPIYYRIKHFIDTAAIWLSRVQHAAVTIVVDPADLDILTVGSGIRVRESVQAWASALGILSLGKTCTLMHEPVPPGDVQEARLASLHAGLQGHGATHFGTQYCITDMPTLDCWTEVWGEGAISVPPQVEARAETEDREAEEPTQPDVSISLDEGQLVENAQPEENEDFRETGPPVVMGVQPSITRRVVVWTNYLIDRRHSAKP